MFGALSSPVTDDANETVSTTMMILFKEKKHDSFLHVLSGVLISNTALSFGDC
jgi:hypothetical protein